MYSIKKDSQDSQHQNDYSSQHMTGWQNISIGYANCVKKRSYALRTTNYNIPAQLAYNLCNMLFLKHVTALILTCRTVPSCEHHIKHVHHTASFGRQSIVRRHRRRTRTVWVGPVPVGVVVRAVVRQLGVENGRSSTTATAIIAVFVA